MTAGRSCYRQAREDPGRPPAEAQGKYMDAVVKVYCVHTEPNYSLPWQRKRQFASTSTGFLIDAGGDGQRWLLTNAHSVEYHSQVPAPPLLPLLEPSTSPAPSGFLPAQVCALCGPKRPLHMLLPRQNAACLKTGTLTGYKTVTADKVMQRERWPQPLFLLGTGVGWVGGKLLGMMHPVYLERRSCFMRERSPSATFTSSELAHRLFGAHGRYAVGRHQVTAGRGTASDPAPSPRRR